MSYLVASEAALETGAVVVARKRLNRRAVALLATTALVAASAALLPDAALAQNATWLASPGSGDFNTGTNWNPAAVPTGTAFFGTSGSTNLSISTDVTVGGWTFNSGASAYNFSPDNLTFTGAGIVINGGSATINISNGSLLFNSGSTAGNAFISITSFAPLDFEDHSTAGSAVISNDGGSTTAFLDTSTAGSAKIVNTNFGSLLFLNTSTAGSASITNNSGGSAIFNSGSTAGSATVTNSGALVFEDSSTAGSATITNNSGGVAALLDSTSGGTARFILNGTGSLDISGLTTGGTTAGSIEGAGNVFLGSNNLAVGGNNLSTTFSGVIQDGGLFGGTGGSLTKTGTGTLILSGANTYTGDTIVSGGTLSVYGSIASSPLTTVDAGGTLGGNGFVGTTFINGGTLSPGNSIGTLTVTGSLTLTSAATYLVQVSGTSADKTVVTGAANLAGQVTVDPLTRVSATTTYTILTAGTVSGTFATVNAAGNFARNARLSYVGGNVLLTLDPGLLSPNLPGSANINQRNVAAGIDNALIAGGNMPVGFNALFALTGSALTNALTQASGETATGSQQSTFNAMNLFMGVVTDPFVAGRGDPVTAGSSTSGASAYASQDRPRSGVARDANAMFTKAPPMADSFTQRWSVWAAGYGGSQTTNGNATLGSNNATSRIAGTAVGADYRISPYTLAGFALAGGGTNFSVVNGGSGRSDLFQAGAFIRHTIGQGLFLRRTGLWLAGHHHQPHRDGCRHRSVARGVQRQRLLGSRRRGLSFRRTGAGWRHRHHALRRRSVHHLRPARLR